jgi:hypothetical protein
MTTSSIRQTQGSSSLNSMMWLHVARRPRARICRWDLRRKPNPQLIYGRRMYTLHVMMVCLRLLHQRHIGCKEAGHVRTSKTACTQGRLPKASRHLGMRQVKSLHLRL